jgi:hypothetical protein
MFKDLDEREHYRLVGYDQHTEYMIIWMVWGVEKKYEAAKLFGIRSKKLLHLVGIKELLNCLNQGSEMMNCMF